MAFWEITLKSIAKSQCEDIHGKVLLFHVTHAYVLLLLYPCTSNLYWQSQDFELLNEDFRTDYRVKMKTQ